MDRTDPIGKLIDRLCHTREQLADELGVSPAALYSWSVGRRSPRPGNRNELARIARAHARELADLAAVLETSPRRAAEAATPALRSSIGEPGEQHRTWRLELRELRSQTRDARAKAPAITHKFPGLSR